MIYICVKDKTQKWVKISIWFESRVNVMSRVKIVNDLKQESRKKFIPWFVSRFVWFESCDPSQTNHDFNQGYITKIKNLHPRFDRV